MLDRDGKLQPMAIAHADSGQVRRVAELRSRDPFDADSPHGAPAVVRSATARLVHDPGPATLAWDPDDEQAGATFDELGLVSMIIAPMVAGGEALGTITFASAESGRRFSTDDLVLAEEVARRAAMAVRHARLYSERSHIASTLQRSLLPPRLPEIDGLELAARFRAQGPGFEVGGDFYDVFEFPPGGWAIVMGDVAGKGPDAAAITASGALHAADRSHARGAPERDPRRLERGVAARGVRTSHLYRRGRDRGGRRRRGR